VIPSHVLVSTLGGAAFGYGYYRLVGCRSGVCPLTSSAVRSTLYGAFMGLLASAS
jgi:hypothetical protein